MLTLLEIKNFLLISELKIPFNDNLTVITGETGAGKSILMFALMLVLGDRLGGKKVIRPNCNAYEAIIIAHFDLRDNDNALNYITNLSIGSDDTSIIVRRHIFLNGKSKFFINDIPVTNQVLTNLKEYILEICGQHSTRSLLEVANHMPLIDDYSNNLDMLEILSAFYHDLKKITLDVKSLMIKKEQSEIERDFLVNIIKDLSGLGMQENEEESLIEARSKIADKFKVTEIINKVSKRISALDYNNQLYIIEKELERYPDIFINALPALKNAISEIKEFEAQVEEVAYSFGENFNMEQIESRLFKIRSMARKYNTLTAELNNLLNNKKKELDDIDNLDYLISTARQNLKKHTEQYYELAKKISQKRMDTAKELKSKIESYLADLMMEKVEIQINIEEFSESDKWTNKGINKVEFLVRTNPTLNFSNIAKSASGGELSRIMLSLKLALSEKNSANIIVFDEIDTGISGAVSSSVGRKLWELAKSCQVIVITHQPQVAAYGISHLHISKDNDAANVSVNLLSPESSLNEIARMISGKNITNQSLEAAKSLVKESHH